MSDCDCDKLKATEELLARALDAYRAARIEVAELKRDRPVREHSAEFSTAFEKLGGKVLP